MPRTEHPCPFCGKLVVSPNKYGMPQTFCSRSCRTHDLWKSGKANRFALQNTWHLGLNKTARKKHDVEVLRKVEELKKAGFGVLFADLKGFPRPDIIYFDGYRAIGIDIKTKRGKVTVKIEVMTDRVKQEEMT